MDPTRDFHCFSKWHSFSSLVLTWILLSYTQQNIFYCLELNADFVDLLSWALQFLSLNLQTFTDVHLSSCTKPNCLSCSHTCEIFRFSSSTFKLIFNPVFYIVNVACTPESVFVNYLFILVEIMLIRTTLNQKNVQVRAVNPLPWSTKITLWLWSMQRCTGTGQKYQKIKYITTVFCVSVHLWLFLLLLPLK